MSTELQSWDHGIHEARRHVEGAQALAAAVVQIELAVREAQGPVERLTLLVEGIEKTLRELRGGQAVSEPIDLHDEEPAAQELESSVERLQKDLYLCVIQLQFYDRMVQHLGHIADYLASAAHELASPGVTTYADGEPVAPLPAVTECVPGALHVVGTSRC